MGRLSLVDEPRGGERIGMSVHESPEGQAMFGALEESDFTMFNFLPVSKG